MSILSLVQKGKQPRPRRTVLYGVHGVGKTTWATKWPGALVIPTEDGNADIDCESLPLLTHWKDVGKAAQELASSDHHYKTAVLDSADWYEQLVIQALEDERFDQSYGKGHTEIASRIKLLLDEFDRVRDRGMHVVIIAHCEVKRFESPEGDSYDRYMPKLTRQAAAVLQEWADEVLFACYKTYTTEKDEGFGRKRSVGVGSGERVLRTCERPGYLAKNRLGLPPEMPFDFDHYARYLPPASKPGNIEGAIVNGSSKPKVEEPAEVSQ